MIDQFRSRNFIRSLYGANVYGFVHTAFLEYFCATAFTHKFEKTREITPDQLKQLYGRHWPDRSWHEVLRLICGILDEKFAGYLGDAGTLPLLREIAKNDSADSLRETVKLLVAELESKQKKSATS